MKKLSNIVGLWLLSIVLPAQTAVNFNYTGGVQTFTVPCGVYNLTIDCWGAQGGSGGTGGNSSAGGTGGMGSHVTGNLAVTPGSIIYLTVGGGGAQPTGGFNGGGNGGSTNAGGGGGASDVRVGGSGYSNRVMVAGGGGGGGRGGCELSSVTGGNGGSGGLNGVGGTDAPTPNAAPVGVAGGGGGGVGVTHGARGAGCSGFLGTDGVDGVTGQGGMGGAGQSCCCFNANSIPGGGGGGGGYLGGGGGGGGSAGAVTCSGNDKGGGGGGAGGSNYAGGVTNSTIDPAARIGDGLITITYTEATESPAAIIGPNAVCGGSINAYSVNAVAGAASYVWSITGGLAIISGNGTNAVQISATSTNGSLLVRAVNTCGDTSLPTSLAVIVNAPPTVGASANVNNVCSGTPVTLSGTGAASYNWSGGVTNGVTFNPATTATYSVTGTDANNCTGTAAITVTIKPRPVVTATASTTSVCQGGSVTLTGGGASTYVWNNTVTNGMAFVPSNTATYTVTGTGTNGCTNTATVGVTVKSSPTVSANTTANNFCQGTSVSLTGGGAASYSWSNAVTDGVPFTPQSTATYSVTGTASNNCTGTATITLTVKLAPTVTANATAVSVCAGTPVTLSGNGASSYAWSNAVVNGVAFTPLSTVTYVVTGTGSNGCTDTAAITIAVKSNPVITANTSSPSVCLGTQVTLTGSGASAYSWNNAVVNGVAFSPTNTATYTVTGTANNNCTGTASLSITVKTPPQVTANSTGTVICSGSQITLSGGGASTYIWSHSVQNGVAFTPVSTTTFSVTGTATNGCTDTATVLVTVKSKPIVTATASTNNICAGDSVTCHGQGAISYVWNHAISDGTPFAPASTNTYIVTGTAANGCTDTAAMSIVVKANPIVSIVHDADSVCAGNNVTLSGAGADHYSWNNAIVNGVSFIPANTAWYVVTGIATNNCSGKDSIQIVVKPIPVINISAHPRDSVCVGTNITLTATGANTYQWSGGILNGTPFPATTSSVFTVTALSENGCSAIASVPIVVEVCTSVVPIGELLNDVQVYPNPVINQLYINSKEIIRAASLIAPSGKVVARSTEAGLSFEWNMNDFTSGIYFLELIQNDGTRKLIRVVKN